jgi:hypothetical protein
MSYPSPHPGWQPTSYQQPMPPHGYGYPPAPPKKRNTGIIIALICAVAVIIAAFFMFVAPMLFIDKMMSDGNEMLSNSSGGNTEQILDDDLDIDFGTFTRDRTYSSITVGKLPVTVHNKSSERATYSIQIEAVDANGDRIAEDSLYITNLAPGQSVTKDVFTINSDDYYELTKATFKVEAVSKY